MKKVLFCITVIALAMSVRAFTTTHKSIGDFFIQNEFGQYEFMPNVDFSASNCVTEVNPCAYQILTNTPIPMPITLEYITLHPEQFQPLRNTSNEIIEGYYIKP